MRMHIRWAASGLALSALLAAAPVAAQNRNESTPAERAQTRALNNQIQQNNAAAEAQYKAQLDATNAKAAANDARYRAQQQ